MAYDSMKALYLFIFESSVNKTLKRSILSGQNLALFTRPIIHHQLAGFL